MERASILARQLTRGALGQICYKLSMKRVAATVVIILVPLTAAAETASVLATKRPVTWGMIFALLFLMLGPIKLLGLFATVTKDCDRTFRFRLGPSLEGATQLWSCAWSSSTERRSPFSRPA